MSRRSINDPAIVYHCSAEQTEQIFAEKAGDSSGTLPSTLVAPPNFYTFAGETYNCLKPGLYRFSKPQRGNEQRIVADLHNGFQTGLFLSLLFIRGNRDDFTSLNRLKKKALKRFLVNTCGPASSLVSKFLHEAGFKSRVVYTHTKDTLNSYNNGHVMVEVYNEQTQRYQLIDVDKKCYFIHSSKGILDLFEFCYCLHTSEPFVIKQMTQTTLIDWSGFKDVNSSFNYQFVEYLFYEKTTRELYQRISAIPLILENGQFYATSWGCSTEIMSQHKDWILISPEEFRHRFYEIS